MFNNFYKNKKILITGHTGFKGNMAYTLVVYIGAKIIGISNSFYTKPSHFKLLKLNKKLNISV